MIKCEDNAVATNNVVKLTADGANEYHFVGCERVLWRRVVDVVDIKCTNEEVK